LRETSHTDLVTEITAMKHAFQVNFKALQTSAKMEKTTLDLIG